MPKVGFIRDPSLVLYLPLYELDGQVIQSQDAYGHKCTVTDALWTPRGRDFDGASGLITVPDDAAIQNIFDGGGTIEVWINPRSDGQTNVGRIFEKHQKWFFYTSSEISNKIKIVFKRVWSGDDLDWRTTSREVTLNTWTHLALTYNSSDIANVPIFYVNGSLVSGDELTPPTGTRDTDAGRAIYIGNRADQIIAFDGSIGEVRLYTRILSPLEIQNNYLARYA